MIRGTVAPRFPWGLPKRALAPALPTVLPPIPCPIDPGLGPLIACWACLHVHLVGLQHLYLAVGPSRVTARLEEQFEMTHRVLAPTLGPSLLSSLANGARAMADAVSAELGVQVSAEEAGWWAVAAQASFALAAWFGLHPEVLPEAEKAMTLNKSLRAGVDAIFGEALGARILDIATGDGAGDLLKLVAEVQLTMESTVHPDLTAHEPLA